MIKVFIVDDHPIYIEGVRKALESDKGKVKVVGYAVSFEDLKKGITHCSIDVVLLDLVMPETNGIQCYHHLKKILPDIKVIALTGETDEYLLLDAWLSGIHAIMPKVCDKEELMAAIHQVMKGQRFLGKDLPNIFRALHVERDESAPILTNREEEILKLLASGMKRTKVAEKLDVSHESVKFHCKNIFRKFGKKKLTDVLIEARKYRIIP